MDYLTEDYVGGGDVEAVGGVEEGVQIEWVWTGMEVLEVVG